MYIYIYFMCIYIYIYYIYIYIYTYIYIYIMYIYIYIHYIYIYIHVYVSAQLLCGFVVSAIRRLRKSPQYLFAILQGGNVSLRKSPQNFQNNCADKCQNPGSPNSVVEPAALRGLDAQVAGQPGLLGPPKRGVSKPTVYKFPRFPSYRDMPSCLGHI